MLNVEQRLTDKLFYKSKT